MIVRHSVAVRNAKAIARANTIGASPQVLFYDDGGAGIPASAAAAPTGTLLGTLPLPADWQDAPSNGSAAMKGVWSGPASAVGTVTYYRMLDSTGTTCHELGDVTVTGGGGAMTVENNAITAGGTLTVTSYRQTEGNA